MNWKLIAPILGLLVAGLVVCILALLGVLR